MNRELDIIIGRLHNEIRAINIGRSYLQPPGANRSMDNTINRLTKIQQLVKDLKIKDYGQK